jgi:hypothetical protein
MNSPIDYLELACECIREAEESRDTGRKKTLLGIAKLYNQMALNIEDGTAQDNSGVPRPFSA